MKSLHFSLKNPAKLQCGDSSCIVRIADTNYTLALVADGVSSAPCDWKASSLTIAYILERLGNISQDPEKDLLDALLYANAKLRSGPDGIQGMLSTLSVVLIDEVNYSMWFANAGDSRIYIFSATESNLLTNDQVRSERVILNGAPYSVNGVPKYRTVLTDCIGLRKDSNPEVGHLLCQSGSLVVLASDGFYELPGFDSYISELTGFTEDEAGLLQIQRSYLNEIRDDASVALLVIPVSATQSLETYIDMFYGGATFSKEEVLTLLDAAFNSAMDNTDTERLERMVRFVNDGGFVYDKARMVKILEALIQHGFGNAARDLALVIRKYC